MTDATRMQHIQRILAMAFLGLLLAVGVPGAADAQVHQANVRERLYSSDLVEERARTESVTERRTSRTGGAEAPRLAGVHQGEVLARLYRFDRVESSPRAAPGRDARTDSLLAGEIHPRNAGLHQAHVRERLYSRDLVVAPGVRLSASPDGGGTASGGSDR